MTDRRGRGPTRALLGLVLLVVTALTGCGIGGVAPGADGAAPTSSAPTSTAPTSTVPTGSPTGTARTTPSDTAGSDTAEPASDPAAAGPPTAVFLGDSYTVGFGATSPEAGYVQRTAALMGWRAVVDAQGGTGYVNPSGTDGQSVYAGRLAQVTQAQPDIVVVQGSTNDVGRSGESVEAAATELYRGLRSALPTARIVVLGPLAPPGLDPVAVGDVRDALARASHAAGIPFIDPIAAGWLLPVDGLYADPGHPDDDGYRQLADDLALALGTIGF